MRRGAGKNRPSATRRGMSPGMRPLTARLGGGFDSRRKVAGRRFPPAARDLDKLARLLASQHEILGLGNAKENAAQQFSAAFFTAFVLSEHRRFAILTVHIDFTKSIGEVMLEKARRRRKAG